MKKNFILLIFTIGFVTSNLQLFSQDCGESRLKIFGGTSANFMISGDYKDMKGARPGFVTGLEYEKYFSCKNSLLFGLGYNYSAVEMWLDKDPDNYQWTVHKNHLIEIPIGLKFKGFDNNLLTSFYTSIYYISALAAYSKGQKYVELIPFGHGSQITEGTYMLYNPGAKLEFGYENRFNQLNSYSLSLYSKVIANNYFSPNQDDKYMTMGIGLNLSYIF